MTKKLKSLVQSKQKTISRDFGAPSQKSGKDGDFHIRKIEGQGIFLFYKWGSRWYSSRMSQYRPKTAEHKQPVKLPIGIEPANVGDLTLTTDGNIKVKKGKAKKNQVVSMDSNKRLDVSEFEARATRDAGDSATTTDIKIMNSTGHANLWLNNTSGNTAYDSYLLFTAFSGETHKLWNLGIDSSDTYAFKLDYTSQGLLAGLPIPGSNTKLTLTSGGELTVPGAINSSAGECKGDSASILAFDGSYANGVCTYKDADEISVESEITYGALGLSIVKAAVVQLKLGYDSLNYAYYSVENDGGLTLTNTGTDAHISIVAHKALTLSATNSSDATINAANIILSADVHTLSEKSIGFTQNAELFSDDSIIGSAGTHDTHIDFRLGNKASLALTNDITNLNLIFPAVSGNFTLLLTYDGDHDITNWKAYESDGSAADGNATVLWANGAAMPTTDSGVDIVSFFWDATAEIAYAVGSTAFAVPS